MDANIAKRIFLFLKWAAAGILAFVLTTYLLMLVINGHDEPPTPTATAMSMLVESRPAVPDAENGYVFFAGLCAKQDEDPSKVGAEYISKVNAAMEMHGVWLGKDMQIPDCSGVKDNNVSVTNLLKFCGGFDAACYKSLLDNEQHITAGLSEDVWLYERYKKLLSHKHWRMALKFDLRSPFLPFTAMRHGQTRLMLKAWTLAGQGKVAEVRELLHAEASFLRTVIASADILFDRIVATSILQRHFSFGNLVLRRLGKSAIRAVPLSWNAPLTGDELSTKRVSAGEMAFAASIIRDHNAYRDIEIDGVDVDDRVSFVERFVEQVFDQFMMPQATVNEAADQIQQLVKILDVPFEKFQDAIKKANALVESYDEFQWYNPYGHYMVAIIPMTHVEFATKVYDLEGVRRAVLLTTQLRSQNVDVTQVGEYIAKSVLRNPYDHTPFTWDDKKQGIRFRGLQESKAKAVVYLY